MSVAPLKSVAKVKTLMPASGDTPIEVNGVRVFQIALSVSELMTKFRENTYQRDTELRKTRHLEILQPEHLEISAMQTITGELVLINGHTRLRYWKLHTPMAPVMARVTIFDIVDETIDAAREELRLYSSFDSRSAVKTSAHAIQSVIRSLSLSFDTPWLRAGKFANALVVAGHLCGLPGTLTKEELMDEFREELLALDGIAPRDKEFVSPFLTAALVMLRKAPRAHMVDLLASYQENDSAKKFVSGANQSIYYVLREYRRSGLNGQGRFPTNSADMLAATTKIARYFYLALTMGETTMIDPSSVRAFTVARLRSLKVEPHQIAMPV